MVSEAQCWGGVDSKVARVDQFRTKTYFTPRRPTSAWSVSNERRVERLLAEGRVRAPGLAAIETTKSSGRWD